MYLMNPHIGPTSGTHYGFDSAFINITNIFGSAPNKSIFKINALVHSTAAIVIGSFTNSQPIGSINQGIDKGFGGGIHVIDNPGIAIVVIPNIK